MIIWTISWVTPLYQMHCNPMDGSTPGFPVLHQLAEHTQTHVYRVGDAIHLVLCHPLLLPPSIFPSIFDNLDYQFNHSIMFDDLRPRGIQHTRLPCPKPTPRAYSNSCPSIWWCHPTISSFVVPFYSHLQSVQASRSSPVSQIFAQVAKVLGVSASQSVLPTNIQDRFPLGWTAWISLQSKGLSRAFSSTTVQKHQFFTAQLSLYSISNTHTWLVKKPQL